MINIAHYFDEKLPLYTAAGRLLECGLSVVPCTGKKAFGYWQTYQNERATQSTLDYWQRTGKLNNLAIILGAISQNLICVDCDGETAVNAFFTRFPELCNGLTVLTGSGKGAHVYLQIDDMPPNRKVYGKEGIIELRGGGQYVICPPSVHPETMNKYQVISGNPVLNVPHINDVFEWLMAVREAQRPKQAPKPQPIARLIKTDRDTRAAISYELYLASVRSARDGEQNDCLYKAALRIGNLVGAGLVSRSNAEIDLYNVALAIGYVTKDGERQTNATINSGLNAGEKKPNYATY